jgi:hypothetical protein
MKHSGPTPGEEPGLCSCLDAPSHTLRLEQSFGLDSHLGEVDLLVCLACGLSWLRYFYELEAFTGSGRWYLGPLAADQAANLNLENARELLEQMPWYFYGGSYYDGKTGKTSGMIGI